ncbi:ABC transporter ATP-binding protein [Phreatobacter aquaticus]|uniref:ABC transporter ATP-binding protein n=1 Tax=Phreatobacter aquaticus TaxID=2570229 RepID=A0A4D7QLT9_9HYPH|nr:ABC transporter ATP-binding protein [Phreatobacter aquaticus]QCK88175.1 ABC transporter ATP-binding protein [Phreatobacter aquaticus]
MSSDVAIRVEGLTKSFRLFERPEHRLLELMSFGRVQRHRTFTALKDVSLEIRRGETVGIVGRNGCGKSTLLQVICGILQPTAGTVTTHGRIAALLELGAGFDGNFTGRENVYLNGAIHGCTRAEMDERFEAIAAFADIGEFLDRPVKTYSSGMFVRLAFATAVNVDPDILVVDEALAVGDEAFQRKCFARIEQIKERGATVLFVSHAAQTIIQLCDRAVLMAGGEKLMEGTPKAVVTTYQQLNAARPDQAAHLRSGLTRAQVKPKHQGQETEGATETGDHFDPTIESQSRTVTASSGVQITDVQLQTLDGRQVNRLVAGRRYLVTFTAQFTIDSDDVGIAMSIRTPNGTAIAGVSTQKSAVIRISIKAADYNIFNIEFDARLAPGSYFINVTVNSASLGTMGRITDALMFIINHEEDDMLIAPADLHFRLNNERANR